MALAKPCSIADPILCGPGTRQRLPLSPACTSSQRPNVDGTFKEMTASQLVNKDVMMHTQNTAHIAIAHLLQQLERDQGCRYALSSRICLQFPERSLPDGTQRSHVCLILDRCSHRKALDELGVRRKPWRLSPEHSSQQPQSQAGLWQALSRDHKFCRLQSSLFTGCVTSSG